MSKFTKLLSALVAILFLTVACTPSPKSVCKKMSKMADEEISSEDMDECIEGLGELKDKVKGSEWRGFAKCVGQADGEEGVGLCMLGLAAIAGGFDQ